VGRQPPGRPGTHQGSDQRTGAYFGEDVVEREGHPRQRSRKLGIKWFKRKRPFAGLLQLRRHPCARRRRFHQRCARLAPAAGKTRGIAACVPCHRPRRARHLPRTERSHPGGAESPARRRSPTDEAAPGLALPCSLSVRDQIVTAAANRAGDCSTAITVPGPVRLHPLQ